jgi:hypothetical protein
LPGGSYGGSDTDDPLAPDTPVWSRQHEAIEIDADRDVITDDGGELVGVSPVLVADLTDAMYDPADPPYVDHDAGTRLVIGYIEAFLAPTTQSGEVACRLAYSRARCGWGMRPGGWVGGGSGTRAGASRVSSLSLIVAGSP